MSSKQPGTAARSSLMQFGISFVIPTIILLTLSGNDHLGPLGAMGVALAFPVGLELYGLTHKRKPSLMSIASIVGILLVGVISVLGLSREWLALRRGALYAGGAIALYLIVKFKPAWIEKGLDRVFEMEGVRRASRQRKTEDQLFRHVVKASYLLVVVLALVAIASYALTFVFITAPTGSIEFNTQYAKLRILSIFAITAPLVIAVTAILVYLVVKFEKLTGVSADELIKKHKKPS